MSINPINLVSLLELPGEQFLPEAFTAIVGREPDAIGVMHYASKLQHRAPRQLILAELRNSAEGRAHVKERSVPDLEKLLSRYLAVRNLPLGAWRWALLPRTAANIPSDSGFNWERWANDFVSQQNALAAQQAIAAEQALAAAQTPPAPPSPQMQNLEQVQLQGKLDAIAVALTNAAAALQAKGAPDRDIHPLRETAQRMLLAPPDPNSVPWEARQVLHRFWQILSH